MCRTPNTASLLDDRSACSLEPTLFFFALSFSALSLDNHSSCHCIIFAQYASFAPTGGLHLGGISLARQRQVIELLPPPPVEVIEHRVYKGWCSCCQKWREAPLDVVGQVIGKSRLGVRISSLIATLRTVMRVPVRQIQFFLKSV